MSEITSMTRAAEDLLFSSFLASSEMPLGESKTTRRRRRKTKRDGDGDDAKKRRLTDAQLKFLEMSFQDERKLDAGRKVHLAGELGLDPKQVAVWFQNRRARHRNKQVEEAYAKLKTAHDAVVVEKCHLENEVFKLKEKLSKAEEEIKKLSSLGISTEGGAPGSSNSGADGSSPSSSFSAFSEQPLMGEFGVEEVDLMYMHEFNSYNNMMEWANFYGVV
ncbi:homeobox-leucine zipper protein HOX12-like [Canna indica]|uniref:Homeobox-leucine zipper protein n=1 Tax=Canna indica TaxID=4628 RepID=A0AAQ3JMM5_9LILI|nr:homeobox-leucine zipper protein HOX12-like [Canna indica]